MLIIVHERSSHCPICEQTKCSFVKQTKSVYIQRMWAADGTAAFETAEVTGLDRQMMTEHSFLGERPL